MGRRTYEAAYSHGTFKPDQHVIVASDSLQQEVHEGVEVVRMAELEQRVRELKAQPGRDIWLYGGGALLSQLLAWNLVDTVEPAIMPILLGGGIPMLAPHGVRRRLTLVKQQTYPSGMVLMAYEVEGRYEHPSPV